MPSESVSIILPTFCEVHNITNLIKRIANTNFGNRTFEVLLIDDNSQDGTEELVVELTKLYPWLRLLVRRHKKGLSASVLHGFNEAKYSLFVVMDADLSHPPEKIPEMLDVLEKNDVDLVVGSRYIAGGSSDAAWPFIRKLTSHIAASFAKFLIGLPVKDPLSGFIAIRKETYLSAKFIDPVGWKIGLELMVKCGCTNIQETPIHFSERAIGQSKLNLKVIWDYLTHLKRLMFYRLFVK